jgi:predicted nucleic acid-binding Zn ribbon protein
MSSVRRRPTRVGDVLPTVAGELGIEAELRRARQMATWQRLVAELVPGSGTVTSLLDVQPGTLVVSASSPSVAQELRLRQHELLDAFARAPDGVKRLELRVVVRAADGGGPAARVD